MSDLLGQLDDLVSDETSQAEYRHEIAISAFTNDVARLMSEQSVSQSELARRLGVSRARVSQLLQHRSSPTLRTMVEVAAALGCEVSPVVAPRGFRSVRLCVSDTTTSSADGGETGKWDGVGRENGQVRSSP